MLFLWSVHALSPFCILLKNKGGRFLPTADSDRIPERHWNKSRGDCSSAPGETTIAFSSNLKMAWQLECHEPKQCSAWGWKGFIICWADQANTVSSRNIDDHIFKQVAILTRIGRLAFRIALRNRLSNISWSKKLKENMYL